MKIKCLDCSIEFEANHKRQVRCSGCQKIARRATKRASYYRVNGKDIPFENDIITIVNHDPEDLEKKESNLIGSHAICRVIYDPDEDCSMSIGSPITMMDINMGIEYRSFTNGFIYERDNLYYMIAGKEQVKLSEEEMKQKKEKLSADFLKRMRQKGIKIYA